MTDRTQGRPPSAGQIQRQTRFCILLFAAAAVSIVALVAIESITTYSSDDYYYAMFWRNGLRDFVAQNISHFSSRNGRVLVHVLAETLLALGMFPFAVFNTAALLGIMALFLCYQRAGEKSLMYWAMAFAVFFCGVFLVDYHVWKSWILCVADSCNYIFPLLVVGTTLWCLDRFSRRGWPYQAAICLLALLSGATTEQGGAIAILLLAVHILRKWMTEKRVDKLALLSLVFAFLGLLTIFASPATRDRAGAEFSIGGVLFGFAQYATCLAAPGMSLNILSFLCVVMGLLPLEDRAPKLLCAGLPIGLFLMAGYLLPHGLAWNIAACLVFFAYVFAAALALMLRSPYHRSGAMLLAGLGSAVPLMLSQSVSIRITTPFLLLILLCAAFFLAELCVPFLEKNQRMLFPAALGIWLVLGISVLIKAPAMAGMWTNYQILLQNEQAVEKARLTHVLEYTDYQPYYNLADLFSDEMISAHFLAYYELGGEVTVIPTYEAVGTVLLSGVEQPVVRYHDRLYVPLRAVIDDRGGELRYMAGNYIWIRLEDEIVIHFPALYTGKGTVDVTNDVIRYDETTFLSIDQLDAVFQIRIDPVLW